jgi:hypothetical protein
MAAFLSLAKRYGADDISQWCAARIFEDLSFTATGAWLTQEFDATGDGIKSRATALWVFDPTAHPEILSFWAFATAASLDLIAGHPETQVLVEHLRNYQPGPAGKSYLDLLSKVQRDAAKAFTDGNTSGEQTSPKPSKSTRKTTKRKA